MKCSIEVDGRLPVCYIELHPWALLKASSGLEAAWPDHDAQRFHGIIVA
jgi:hypothetical protein